VIHRHECDLHSNLLVEILEHCIVKVLCIVGRNVSRDTVAADANLPEEFSDCRRAYVGESHRLFPLHEILNYHNDEGVVALCGG
jgi:hypothetical protein